MEVYGEGGVQMIFYSFIDAMGLAFLLRTPTLNGTWWYMSLAVLLVFLTPLLIEAVKKVHLFAIPLSILLPRLMIKDLTVFWQYLLPLMLGICFAEFNIFEKMKHFFKDKYYMDCVMPLCVLLGGAALRQRFGFTDILDGIMAAAVCYLMYRIVMYIPIVNKGLQYLGVHSINLFMIHTFIFKFYFREFIYGFRYTFLILLVLLGVTLLLSIGIEKIKIVFRVKRAEKAMTNWAVRVIKNLQSI